MTAFEQINKTYRRNQRVEISKSDTAKKGGRPRFSLQRKRGLPPISPGNLPSQDGKYSLYCAVIVKQVDEKTRAKVSLNELLRDL